MKKTWYTACFKPRLEDKNLLWSECSPIWASWPWNQLNLFACLNFWSFCIALETGGNQSCFACLEIVNELDICSQLINTINCIKCLAVLWPYIVYFSIWKRLQIRNKSRQHNFFPQGIDILILWNFQNRSQIGLNYFNCR